MSNSQSSTNPNFQNPTNFQNSPLVPNSQNSQNNHGNFPFCRPPYPYQFPMFQPPPTNPMLNEGISMNISTQQETTSELDLSFSLMA
jgi:hypothetical protein